MALAEATSAEHGRSPRRCLAGEDSERRKPRWQKPRWQKPRWQKPRWQIYVSDIHQAKYKEAESMRPALDSSRIRSVRCIRIQMLVCSPVIERQGPCPLVGSFRRRSRSSSRWPRTACTNFTTQSCTRPCVLLLLLLQLLLLLLLLLVLLHT